MVIPRDSRRKFTVASILLLIAIGRTLIFGATLSCLYNNSISFDNVLCHFANVFFYLPPFWLIYSGIKDLKEHNHKEL